MNKRGAIEILHEKLHVLIILLFVFAVLFYFISQQSSGELQKKQIIAKEICLISIASKSGTIITINYDPSLVIEKKDNGIVVNDKGELIGRGYFYDCYGNFEINALEDGKSEMVIK